MRALICSIILLVVKARAHSLSSHCPDGWTDGQDYGLGCLLFDYNTTRTWNEAQEYCQGREAWLVEIFSDEQQEYLEEKAYEIEGITGRQEGLWIGATDVGSEGVWLWTHSNKVVEFTAWAEGQPTGIGSNGEVENYALLSWGFGYKWNDITYANMYYTICQKI